MADQIQGSAAYEHLRVFHDAARALTSSLDLPTILHSILEQMDRFFQPESWSLLMVDERKRELYYALARGIAADELSTIRIPLGSGISGWVAQHGEPLIVTDDGGPAQASRSAGMCAPRLRGVRHRTWMPQHCAGFRNRRPHRFLDIAIQCVRLFD